MDLNLPQRLTDTNKAISSGFIPFHDTPIIRPRDQKKLLPSEVTQNPDCQAVETGFTLIELLIAITLSAIIISVGIVRYRSFNAVQTIKNTGQTVKNNLRDIQAKAFSGVKPSDCTTTLYSYRVSYSATDYQSQARCNTGGVDPAGSIVTYTLPADIEFNPIPTLVDFFVLGNGASDDRLIQIRATYPDDTYHYSLCITQGGDIKDCGYQKGSSPACSCP